MFYKIKTYKKVSENRRFKLYKNVTPLDETVFDNMKMLLIEAAQREECDNILIRLVTCDSIGTEVRADSVCKLATCSSAGTKIETGSFICINKETKKIRFLKTIP